MRRFFRARRPKGLPPLIAAVLSVSGAFGQTARAQVPPPVAKVTRVDLHATLKTGIVRLIADREPTFTVFKLDQPPRVVIDLSSADVTALERSGRIAGQGLVQSIQATQFDDARSRVGRVVITVRAGTRFEVQSSPTGLVVSLTGTPAPQPVAATAPSPKPAAPLGDNVVRVEVDRLPEGVRGGSRLVLARLSRAGQKVRLELVCDGPIAKYELMELKNPGRIALDLAGFTGKTRDERRQVGDVTALRVAPRQGALRVVLEARGDRFPPFHILRTGHGLIVEVGLTPAPVLARRLGAGRLSDPRAIPRMVASAREEPLAAGPGSGSASLGRTPRVRSLDVSTHGRSTRVVVVLDRQVAVDQSAAPGGTDTLLLHGAALPERLARKLDASLLAGPVAYVASLGVPEGVKLVVGLKRGARAVRTRLAKMRVGPSVGIVWTFTQSDRRPVELAQADPPGGGSGPGGFLGEARAYAGAAGPRAEPEYTGRRVDFTAKDLDIIQFIQAIAEIAKRNIVASSDVKGTVSVRLRNVPWDEALDVVLKTKGLGRENVGDIIRIAPLATLAAEKKQAVEEQKEDILRQPLKVRLIPVNYATAEQVASRVKDVLTSRGTVSVDARTNVLVVKDIVSSLAKAEQLVHLLDTQTPEVLIEARIVEAQSTFTQSVGIQWGGNLQASPATGNPTGLIFPNLVSVAGAATDGQTPTSATSANPNFVINFPTAIGTGSGGGVGFVFGSAGGAAQLNLRLSAAEVNGTIKTVSAPKVTTLDNKSATISQGVQIPYSEVSAAGTNTTFMQAMLQLQVTPHVTADGSIVMKINASNNQPDAAFTGANGQPAISQRQAQTEVVVKDGDTTVIGGIYTRSNSLSDKGVPFLDKIPLIGRLFSQKSVSDQRTEMLIFITPHIVNREESVVTETAAP